MKMCLTFGVLLITLNVICQEVRIDWVDLEKAQQDNKENKKIIFILIYGEWCEHCKMMMETTLNDSGIVNLINEDFIPVKFNAESKNELVFNNKIYGNSSPGKLKSKHNFAIKYAVINSTIGFPTYLFFNSDLELIAEPVRGYKNVSSFSELLMQINRKDTFSFVVNNESDDQKELCE
jgi:thioredoxin-related protein